MKKAEVKATGEVRINPYIAPAEKVEIDEIKSALALATAEYIAAEIKEAETKAFYENFVEKTISVDDNVDSLNKEIRKTEASYKRSSRRETLTRLYNKLVYLREELEKAKAQQLFLAEIGIRLVREHKFWLQKKMDTKKAMKQAKFLEGFKYEAMVYTKYGERKAAVKTIFEAVRYIYSEADNGHIGKRTTWEISEYNSGKLLAHGYTLNELNFSMLIEKFDEKCIDAEISAATEKNEFTPATLKDEFNYIVARAIHNFTFNDFVKSIEELKAFCQKAARQDKDLFETAREELQEWIEIASSNGVNIEQIEDIEAAATEEEIELPKYAVRRMSKYGDSSCFDYETLEEAETEFEYEVEQGNFEYIELIREFTVIRSWKKGEALAEDDGSNDEPEEDFLASYDASVDEEEDDDELIDEPIKSVKIKRNCLKFHKQDYSIVNEVVKQLQKESNKISN